MSKSVVPIDHDQVLREEDQAKFTLVASLLSRIEAYRAGKGLAKQDMRVLDWGCGRGRTVLWLRERGYQAYGVEIDARPVENGRPLARSRGLDAEQVLKVMEPGGHVPYPDGFFHFITSAEVFEHVRDLEGVAREMARLLAPGGRACHVYAATWFVVEGHLLMPFVHWLPKNRLRLWLIRLWIWLGVEARLPAYEGLTPEERAQKFYRFTLDETFYRSIPEVRRPFERAGLVAYTDTAHGPMISRHPLTRHLVDLPLLGGVLEFALSRFARVHLIVKKPEASEV